MELNDFEVKLIKQLRKSKIENPFLMKFYDDKHNCVEITILEKTTTKITDDELQLFLMKMPTHFSHYSKLIDDAIIANKDWTYFNTYHIQNKNKFNLTIHEKFKALFKEPHDLFIFHQLYSKKFEHIKWRGLIPHIVFPKEWRIKIIPPFNGAMVRFEAYYGNEWISVYLDCYKHLGFFYDKKDELIPYWEAYPMDEDGSPSRFSLEAVDELINAMKAEFKRRELNDKK